MSVFGDMLRERREKLQLTRDEFASRASVSANYLISIEARGNRIPHRKKLLDIIRVASCWTPAQARTANAKKGLPPWTEINGAVVATMLTAVDDSAHVNLERDLRLHRHPTLKDELAEQHEEPEGSEVWILSDILAEAQDAEAAKRTADNIATKRMTYRFFVPFSSPQVHWQTAIDQLEAAVGRARKGLLQERVRIYRLSDCAFGCRVRISRPDSEAPVGRYSIGGTSGDAIEFVPAPPALMAKIATNLGTLCKRADAGWTSSDPVVGVIERVYPPRVDITSSKKARKRR